MLINKLAICGILQGRALLRLFDFRRMSWKPLCRVLLVEAFLTMAQGYFFSFYNVPVMHHFMYFSHLMPHSQQRSQVNPQGEVW